MNKQDKSRRIKITKKLFKKKKVFKITKIEKKEKKHSNIKTNLIKKNKNSLISISREVFDLLKINRTQSGTQVQNTFKKGYKAY